MGGTGFGNPANQSFVEWIFLRFVMFWVYEEVGFRGSLSKETRKFHAWFSPQLFLLQQNLFCLFPFFGQCRVFEFLYGVG